MSSSKTILCSILVLSLSNLFAQETEKKWIGLETDPITTIFGARTLSVVVEPPKIQHWSLFLNVVSADFPNWMDDFLNPKNKEKGFDSKINIRGGFEVDYFIWEFSFFPQTPVCLHKSHKHYPGQVRRYSRVSIL